MGTRNLTIVHSNGEYKVAQYGQWDGYPEGLGCQLLKYLKGINISELRNAVNSISEMKGPGCRKQLYLLRPFRL